MYTVETMKGLHKTNDVSGIMRIMDEVHVMVSVGWFRCRNKIPAHTPRIAVEVRLDLET